MSYYARLRLVLEVSEASDYSRPQTHAIESTNTPDERRVEDVIEVATAGQAYSLSFLSSISKLIIHNKDTTNYLTFAYTRSAGGAQSIKIPAGEVLVIPGAEVDVSASITLTANTAAVLVGVSWLGT